MELAFLPDHDHLRDEDWPAQNSPSIAPGASMFETIAAGDVLLFHPYESFDPVIRLLEEAAADPDVIAIKQILYRTARQSRIIDALIRAAENGKHVTVLVDLKARFDEARNLNRADERQDLPRPAPRVRPHPPLRPPRHWELQRDHLPPLHRPFLPHLQG
jgi:polyphosphate kinase